MKYWGYLVAKLAVAAPVVALLYRAVNLAYPPLPPWANPISRDFPRTFWLLGVSLLSVGIGWFIIWDQRYRCRTCLRRLRMPIQRGSWTHVLLGAPLTEYICPYGHGTLTVADLQITGHQEPDWQPHQDMWKELLSLEETKK
jgi:hypothetical protein